MNPNQYLQQLNIFVFAKDNLGRFLFCNEKFAEAAGADSPEQLIGKDDYSLCWQDQADIFRTGDASVINGQSWHNVQEKQLQINNSTGEKILREILVSKYQLKNRLNKCIGVVGSYIDITNHALIKKPFGFEPTKKRFYLGPVFANDYLTKRETDVLKQILWGRTSPQIAANLNITKKTAEGYIETIKLKLQCSSKSEIVATAVKLGLIAFLY